MTDPHSEMLRKHVQILSEHFDSIQIFATQHISDGPDDTHTKSYRFGSGDWFARYGHVKDWIIKVEDQTRREDDTEDTEDAEDEEA
jgi:hypothetical protein